MNNRIMIGVSIGVVGAMLLAAWIVASGMPDATKLPIHWGLHGADGFAGKWVALTLPAIIAAGLCALIAGLHWLEPNAANLARSQGLINAVWAGTLAIMVAVQVMVVSVALHWPIDAGRVLVVAVWGLFVGAGNFLGKSRPMALAGIRTKWTLANEDVWIATHRFGGKLMVAGGLIWILAGVFLPLTALVWGVLIAVELIAALVPMGYSYAIRR